MRRKKFLFHVKLHVVELSAVPFVSGILFAKIRTKIRTSEGSKFVDYTNRVEVQDHRVSWEKQVEFEAKLTARRHSGVLEKSLCRLSVRKELEGGKSLQKLGYVDLNLAEYAGQGKLSRNYILQGYKEKHRLDNSMLKIDIQMTLVSGDPLFKVPASDIAAYSITGQPSPQDDLTEHNKGVYSEGGNNSPTDSITATSNNLKAEVISLTHASLLPTEQTSIIANNTDAVRSPSLASDISKQSASASLNYPASAAAVMAATLSGNGHHRTPSLGAIGHSRSPSNGSTKAFLSLRKPASNERDHRIDSTRVDSEGVVDELFGGVSLDDSQPEPGLQLFISEDGSASVTGHRTNGSLTYNR